MRHKVGPTWKVTKIRTTIRVLKIPDSLHVPCTAAYPEQKLYDFSIGKALKNNSALLVVTHTTNS